MEHYLKSSIDIENNIFYHGHLLNSCLISQWIILEGTTKSKLLN